MVGSSHNELLLPENRRLRGVIQTVNFVLHFGGEADAMKFITAPQTAHGLADLANLANLRTCVTVFNVDAAAGLGPFARVVAVIRNVRRAVLDEIVVRIESRAHDDGTRRIDELSALTFRHVELDGLKETAFDEPVAKVLENWILCPLPLL